MFQVSSPMSQYCKSCCFHPLRFKSMTMNHVSGFMSHVPSRYDHESCFRYHVSCSVFAMNFSPSILKVVTKVCCRSSICCGKNRNGATFQQSMTSMRHSTRPGPCSLPLVSWKWELCNARRRPHNYDSIMVPIYD